MLIASELYANCCVMYSLNTSSLTHKAAQQSYRSFGHRHRARASTRQCVTGNKPWELGRGSISCNHRIHVEPLEELQLGCCAVSSLCHTRRVTKLSGP